MFVDVRTEVRIKLELGARREKEISSERTKLSKLKSTPCMT
jgi:hypothetical protein